MSEHLASNWPLNQDNGDSMPIATLYFVFHLSFKLVSLKFSTLLWALLLLLRTSNFSPAVSQFMLTPLSSHSSDSPFSTNLSLSDFMLIVDFSLIVLFNACVFFHPLDHDHINNTTLPFPFCSYTYQHYPNLVLFSLLMLSFTSPTPHILWAH